MAESTYGKDFLPYRLALVRGFYRTMKRRLSLGTGGEGARLLLNAPMCFSSSSSAWVGRTKALSSTPAGGALGVDMTFTRRL